MDTDYVMQQLEKMNASMTGILVEQGKLSQSVSTLVAETTAKQKEIQDHDQRLTKIEGVIRILQWGAGLLTTGLGVVVAKLFTSALGG